MNTLSHFKSSSAQASQTPCPILTPVLPKDHKHPVPFQFQFKDHKHPVPFQFQLCPRTTNTLSCFNSSCAQGSQIPRPISIPVQASQTPVPFQSQFSPNITNPLSHFNSSSSQALQTPCPILTPAQASQKPPVPFQVCVAVAVPCATLCCCHCWGSLG